MNPVSMESEADDNRLQELQKLIHDRTYLKNAIERIAVVLSRQLVENRNDGRFNASVVIR